MTLLARPIMPPFDVSTREARRFRNSLSSRVDLHPQKGTMMRRIEVDSSISPFFCAKRRFGSRACRKQERSDSEITSRPHRPDHSLDLDA